jgi:3-oxoacyl-(acyl-carrier-protein) synthase
LPRAGLVLTYEAPGIDRLLAGIFEDFLKLRRGEALPDLSRGAPAQRAAGGPQALEAGSPEEAAFFEAVYLRHRQAVYESQSFMHLHLAARIFGLHGPALFVNNACASGLYALEAAAAMIRSGSCDTVLVAAAEAARLPTKHRWFQETQVLSAKGSLRPFDRDRDGLVLGEGACGLVLESEQAARDRGAQPYAKYLGGAFVQEAWKVAVPNLTQPWYEETLRRACAAARVDPKDIDLLNPHGAGTALGDLQEARGLTAVFGEWPERPRITALKGALGHTLGASAALETAASLLALKHQAIPPSIGFENPDPKLKIRLAALPQPAPLRTVMKMACGFAGFFAGAVFQK